MNTRAYHFPLMDPVRAIALLAVVAAHSTFFMAGGGHSLSHIRFDFSVRVFFMISAFLLYRPWVRARLADWDPPSAKAFAWRRFLRIVPAYYLALTVISIWLGMSYVFTPAGIPTYYGFFQVYRPGWAVLGLPQAWSLCVEVVFYAFLLFWGALMHRLPARDNRAKIRQELIGAAVLAAICFVYNAIVAASGTLDHASGVPFGINTLTYLDDFAIGMALGTLSAWYEGRSELPRPIRVIDRFPSIAWGIGLVVLAVTTLFVGLFGHVGQSISGAAYVERHYLLGLIAVLLLLPAMFGDPHRGLTRRLLGNRVFVYLGVISYGVYLWHFAVLEQLRRWDFGSFADKTTQAMWFVAALGGAVAISTLSWFLVEKPILGLKGLVKSRPAPQPGEAIAEPASVPTGAA